MYRRLVFSRAYYKSHKVHRYENKTTTNLKKNENQRSNPWVELKYKRNHSCFYPNMINKYSPDITPGSLVTVYGPDGTPYGAGLINPKARVPLRIYYTGTNSFKETDIFTLLENAINFRDSVLSLPSVTNAYRVINSDGDGLSGLIVDRYADVLSISVHCLGVWQRLHSWIPFLHDHLRTKREIINVDPEIAGIEGISVNTKIFGIEQKRKSVQSVCINENGVRFEVNFTRGHKTGFFCDQRNNRNFFSEFTKNLDVLDLCCYTGGFSLYAKVLGGANEVTGVDLDPLALVQARRNAKLNSAKVNFVKADAFVFARDMIQQKKKWPIVVLDPSKFILNRNDNGVGLRKYSDLNFLAINLVKVGGIFVTCSCSGLFTLNEFRDVVFESAFRAGRKLQILAQDSAGPDHPVMSNCPEGEYLKVIWTRVL